MTFWDPRDTLLHCRPCYYWKWHETFVRALWVHFLYSNAGMFSVQWCLGCQCTRVPDPNDVWNQTSTGFSEMNNDCGMFKVPQTRLERAWNKEQCRILKGFILSVNIKPDTQTRFLNPNRPDKIEPLSSGDMWLLSNDYFERYYNMLMVWISSHFTLFHRVSKMHQYLLIPLTIQYFLFFFKGYERTNTFGSKLNKKVGFEWAKLTRDKIVDSNLEGEYNALCVQPSAFFNMKKYSSNNWEYKRRRWCILLLTIH